MKSLPPLLLNKMTRYFTWDVNGTSFLEVFGNHGTTVNAPTTVRRLQHSWVKGNGTNSYVQTGFSGFAASTSWTVGGTFLVGTYNATRLFFGNLVSLQSVQVYQTSGGNIQIDTRDSGNNTLSYVQSGSTPWIVHFVISRNSASNNIKYAINGQVVFSSADTRTGTFDSGSQFQIFSNGGTPSGLSDAACFNWFSIAGTALSDDEVSLLYTSNFIT